MLRGMCIIMIYVVLGGFFAGRFPVIGGDIDVLLFKKRMDNFSFFFFRNEILGLTAVYVHSVLCYLRHNTPWGIEGCAVFLPTTINSIKKKKSISNIFFFMPCFYRL